MSFLIMILSLATACGNTNETTKPQNEQTEVTADASNTAVVQQGMLLGEFTKEDLQKEPFATWFNNGYNNYSPNAEALKTIKENISDYEIVAYMGTWCPDSKRETPKLFKILDESGYDLSKLTIYGVDRSKTTEGKTEEKWNVKRVPTFIFIKDGKEVNRFVEYPKESIEADIAKIVSGKEYNDSYAQ
ncbi:Thiol-disulfide isomerase or thioredoxin [Gillisia sp. Hel1_33_143]|uniref:thioredoxin family protein n=1 Tax=Gillisia sp. Hel1_33_143 TaxID=1336796 RepID=UPI00087D8E02|nr:thioredoxin family protein [Gillisia sp. Hel1_33_143]SDR67049.1 Thiol-disulfide isomerase or thioredoxin [Gillisia sp. Hel1_33_143]